MFSRNQRLFDWRRAFEFERRGELGEARDDAAVEAVFRTEGHERREPIVQRGGVVERDAGGALGDR